MKKRLSVGIMIGNVNAEFSYEMAFGVNKFLSEHNMDATVLMSGSISNSVREISADDFYFSSIYEYYKMLDLDALIITYASIIDLQNSNYSQTFLTKFKDIPFVLLQDKYLSETNSNVLVDNKPGLYALMEHLIVDHKYKNILYVSGPIANYDARERLDVYKTSMKKHGLDVTDRMIVYGDFSKNVEDIVNELLDNNPYVEAIVFANDTMALASYDIIESRGFEIGKDIAVTGFDDLAKASIVKPLLTTVSQDPVGIGYEAGKAVLELLITKQPMTVVLNTDFIKRHSCGCHEYYEPYNLLENDYKSLVNQLVDDIYYKSHLNFDKERINHECNSFIDRVQSFDDINDGVELIKDYVIELVDHSLLYKDIVIDLLSGLFSIIIQLEPEKELFYKDILIRSVKWTLNYIINEVERQGLNFQERFNKSSYLLRNSFSIELSKNEIFTNNFEQLRKLGAKSAYVYLLKDISKCYNKETWKCPNNIYLAAYYNEDEEKILPKKDWVKYDTEAKKVDVIKNKDTIVFSLFSKNSQYGFIVIEVPFNNVDNVQSLCNQLNTLLYFSEIQSNETKVRKELQETLEILEKKNEILNNISKYDELTQIYNRRGLIENAIDLLAKNGGKDTQVIFCDLDHLKEINDTFGHKEGDFAITRIAHILKTTLPKNAIIGRIGGDEFVAIYELGKNNSDKYVHDIKNALSRFNNRSNKPYYIESSVGKIDCNDKPDVDISELINEADKILYEEKKKRRETIIK